MEKMEICHAYTSKINSNFRKKTLSIIPNASKKEWHYLAIKNVIFIIT